MNQKLRAAREQKCWSQIKVAEKVGVSWLTYCRWENGLQKPHPYNLDQLSMAFGKSPEDLGFPFEVSISPAETSVIQRGRADDKAISTEHIPGATHGSTTVDVFSIAVVALLLAQQQYNWTLDELLFRTEQEMKRLDLMAQQAEQKKGNFSRSRRDILSFLIQLPIAIYSLTQSCNDGALSLLAEEVIPSYIIGIPACWRLFFAGGFAEVERVLPTYISHCTFLAQQSSKYQTTAASLASQTHQLAAALVLQREDFGTSLDHCKQASLYGQLAGDPNLLAGALIRQVDALFYRKRHTQVVSAIQEAFSYVNDVSPLMRSRLYSELGSIEAYTGDQQTALRYMGLARDTFPDNPEDDAGFLFTHTNTYILLLNEAFAYMDLKQPKAAWEAMEKAEAYVPVKVSSRGLELLNLQTTIATAKGDMDLSCTKFQAAMAAGSQLGSSLWLNDARDIYYDEMLGKWRNEKQVKDLEDLLR